MLVVAALGLAACALHEPPQGATPSRGASAVVAPVQAPPLVASGPPDWRPGDKWTYAWTSGPTSGIKVVEVVEFREIGATPYYVVRVGDLDHLYTRDLGWAGALRGGRVEIRMVPPEPWFEWPLGVGRRWSQRGTYQDRSGARQRDDSFAVVGEESVEVPGGRFHAFKVVRETADRDSDEYWYAPEVRFYVKWIGRRADLQFEEQLQSYRPAARLISPPGAPAPPSGQK
jgi:hypothetical protein